GARSVERGYGQSGAPFPMLPRFTVESKRGDHTNRLPAPSFGGTLATPCQRALRLRINRSINRMRFRLLTFGGLRLEADGKAATGPPAQRRRLALLTLLAACEQRTITREKAFGLLWPEQTTSGARRLLSE